MPAIKLLRKFQRLRWRWCSIWQLFFSRWFTLSIIALFLSNSWSTRVIHLFFIFFLPFVKRCIPFSINVLVSFSEIYPRSANAFPFTPFTISGIGLQSSTLPVVSLNATISAWWLMIRWSVNPKNQSTVVFPPLACCLKLRCEEARLTWQTVHIVESIKRIPSHLPWYCLSKAKHREKGLWSQLDKARISNKVRK